MNLKVAFQNAFDVFSNKDYKTTYKLYLPFAEKGNELAQNNLGILYDAGQGVLQNICVSKYVV